MTTTSDPLAVTDAWQEVASGAANVSIQNRSTGIVYVAVQAAAPPAVPAAGSDKGAICTADNPVALSGLSGTDKVFVRAVTTAVITVIKS